MCADYNPARRAYLERMSWGRHTVSTPPLDFGETFPGGTAPFLANCLPTEWMTGMFGLVPHWGDPKKLSRMTYNARSETVAEKPAYRNAWKHRQFGLVPVESFYEPCYETGKPIRWRIGRADGEPFALAGIWERRMSDESPAHWSFSMLTVNAESHPLMQRFHKPTDEKRSVVVLDPEDYAGWLNARTEVDARSFLRLFDPDLMVAEADPRPMKRGEA